MTLPLGVVRIFLALVQNPEPDEIPVRVLVDPGLSLTKLKPFGNAALKEAYDLSVIKRLIGKRPVDDGVKFSFTE